MTYAGPSRADLEACWRTVRDTVGPALGLGDTRHLPGPLRCAALCLVRAG
jgi:hypothetical protein